MYLPTELTATPAAVARVELQVAKLDRNKERYVMADSISWIKSNYKRDKYKKIK